MTEDSKASLGAVAGLMGAPYQDDPNKEKSMGPEKSERIRRIDEQVGRLLQER